MNWEAIAASGEMLGGLVVMVSVVYLATQVRQGNRHAQAAAEADLTSSMNQILKDWVTDEKTIATIQRGFDDFHALTKAECALFHMKVGALVNH